VDDSRLFTAREWFLNELLKGTRRRNWSARRRFPLEVGKLKLCKNTADSGLMLHMDMEPNKCPLAESQVSRKTWIGGGLMYLPTPGAVTQHEDSAPFPLFVHPFSRFLT
jgi:hypothetical protein